MESDRNGVSGWLLNRIYRTCNVSGMDGVFDTQNPEISGSSTAHAYKYKTKRQAEMKLDSRKMTFLLISHQATLVLEKHRFAHRS